MPTPIRSTRRARRRAFVFDLLIGLAALVGIGAIDAVINPVPAELTVLLDEERPSASQILLLAFGVIAVADYISVLLSKRRVRQILGASAPAQADDVGECARDQPNVVVAGGFSPFVGAGEEVQAWSFTMNLAEPANAGSPVLPASPADLYHEGESALRALGLPNILVRDEIYADGRDVREDSLLMPMGAFHRPLDVLSAGHMARLIDKQDDRTRHYLAIRFVLWGSQLVLSTFLRYVVVKNVLYVEARSFVLLPLSPRFLALQDMPLVPRFSEYARERNSSRGFSV